MRIAVGSDHAGYELKEQVKRLVAAGGHQLEDVGTHGSASVDYPDFAARVARLIAAGKADLGILVCGSGIGMSIAANKIHGIRAAVCTEPYSARMARQHNDANVLCLGGRVVGEGLMEETVLAFLRSGFEGGRHAKRVEKIHHIESVAPGEPRAGGPVERSER
jgi:ribose 5-phosphate isomerase B